MTRKAETLAFLVSQLASCTPHEMYTSANVYRTGEGSWVFVSDTGVASDPVSESEVQGLVEQNRLPYSEFLRLRSLGLEQFTV
jgi:predicted house-cleaning NTP pyrophosphatase (Maf/HAM1 superfamily)